MHIRILRFEGLASAVGIEAILGWYSIELSDFGTPSQRHDPLDEISHLKIRAGGVAAGMTFAARGMDVDMSWAEFTLPSGQRP
jgi:hypothetical protein